MTKDEFQKAVDDVITDCIRNDYSFGSYAPRVTEAVWPLLESTKKDAAHQKALAESALLVAGGWERKCGELRAKVAEMEKQEPSHWGCTVLQSDGGWKEEVSREAPPEGMFSVRGIFPLYALPGAKGE